MEQPGGSECRRPATSHLGGLRGLGALQMGERVQQRHPSTAALFTSGQGRSQNGSVRNAFFWLDDGSHAAVGCRVALGKPFMVHCEAEKS